MGVVFTNGGRGFARARQRYTAAQQSVVTNLHEAIPEIKARIRDEVDDGPGGIHHIHTGRLNESLHGEGPDAVDIEVEGADGFQVVVGSAVRYATIHARRFAYEGPLVPVDPEMVREVISDHYLPGLKEGA